MTMNFSSAIYLICLLETEYGDIFNNNKGKVTIESNFSISLYCFSQTI